MLSLLLMLAALPQGTDTTVALRGATRLDLNSFEGSVTVTTWSRKEVRIEAHHDRDTRIEVDEGRAALKVHARARYGPAEVDWKLTVPVDLALQIETHEGDIDITGSRGSISANSVEGSMTVRGGAGNIALSTVEGDVRLEDANGNIAISSVDGDIQVRNSRGSVAVNTVDGEIILDQVQSDNVNATTVDGDIGFAGPIQANGRYRLTSHDGNIVVASPAIDADVSVSTFDGDFESDFEVTISGRTERRRMSFTLGKGSARIELESFDGRIRLHKGTTLPARSRRAD